MPGIYAFGSQTTQPFDFGWGSSPNQDYLKQLTAANPGWSGGVPVNPVAGIDPFTGLPITETPPTPKVPTPATGFNPSPTPQAGNNAFGYIPGQLGIPDPAADLQKQIPGLKGLNAQNSQVISSYLSGQVPDDVLRQIQDSAARFGVSSGMPGAGLAGHRGLRDLGLTSLDLQGKGLAAYSPFVGAVSATQTVNPALQAQIAEQNAVNAAAPDPTMAASYAKKLYDEYLAKTARTGQRIASPAGGTGNYANRMPYQPFQPFIGTGYGGGYGGDYGGSTPNVGGGSGADVGLTQEQPQPTISYQGGAPFTGGVPFTGGIPSSQEYNSMLPWWDNGSMGVLQNEVPFDYFNNVTPPFDAGQDWYSYGG